MLSDLKVMGKKIACCQFLGDGYYNCFLFNKKLQSYSKKNK